MISIRILWIGALVVVAFGQEESRRQISTNLRVESDLVLINALVTDSKGKPVTGLSASQFRLSEDGVEQSIKFCSSEDVPVSIGLVLDASGSMGDKIELLRNAAVQFIHAGNPADEYFIVQFHARPETAVPFTADSDRLLGFIDGIKAGGSTALFDAIHLAVSEMRHAHNARKAMLVISDGVDNHSRYTERETRRLIAEVDFPMYGINVWQPQRSGNRYAIQRQDPATLDTLLPRTGGRVFAVRDLRKLAQTTDLISQEIRYEYVLGYSPPNATFDGRFHKVTVQVEPFLGQRLRVSSRRGYYTPAR